MKKQTKIIALSLSLLLLVAACIGISVSADSEKALTVVSQNVSYSEQMYLYYAVYPENVDTEGMVLNVYTENPDTNAEAVAIATVSYHEEVVLSGANGESYVCRAFKTPGVALKNMAAKFYVQAVAVDGTKSPVKSYSVVEYFNEMIYNSENEEDIVAYEKMLAAGDAAQHLLNYYPNGNKNDVPTNYKYIVVKNGTVNGAKKGVYLAGESVTLNYSGEDFRDKWNLLDKSGEVIGTAINGASFVVTDDIVCEAYTNRGTGLYTEAAYNFNDTSVVYSTVKQNGTAVTIDGIYTDYVNKGGDNALRFVNKVAASEAYVNLPSKEYFGDDFAFEADLMLNSDAIAASSTRDNGEIFHIYFGGSGSITWGLNHVTVALDNSDPANPKYKIFAADFDGYTFQPDEWINLRIEFENTKSATRTIKYYVNGELVGTSNKTAALGSNDYTSNLRIVMAGSAGKTATGTLYMDNVFFGTVGNAGSRGNGQMASNANTLTYNGTTATALGEAGKIVLSGAAAFESGNPFAKVHYVNGNAALRIKDTSSSEAYYNIKADKLGKTYVFETDMLLASASSARTDNLIIGFHGGVKEDASESNWAIIKGMKIEHQTINDEKVIVFTYNGVSKQITLGEWFNVRVEMDNTGTSGTEVRCYINGELLASSVTTGTTTALRYIRMYFPGGSVNADIYLDNTYYSAQ